MRRYALVVIVEAPDEEAAVAFARGELLGGELGPVLPDGTGAVYLGEPCPVGPAEEYETEAIHLTADGYLAFAAPLTEGERRA